MKRRIAIVLLLLAGGAIVNVAVAIVLSFGDFDEVHRDDTPAYAANVSQSLQGQYQIRQEPPYWHDRSRFFLAPGAEMYRISGKCDWNGADDERQVLLTHLQTGWPRRSLRGTMMGFLIASRRPGSTTLGPELRLTTAAPDSNARDVMVNASGFVPCGPLLLGFIINTLFYALLLWLLFFAPFAARRMLRRRRGQCEKCAYPIGVSPVCTECGAAVPLKGVERT